MAQNYLHEDWHDGIRAFLLGKKLSDNPHPPSARRRKWKEGFEYAEYTRDAVEDDKKRKQNRGK